MLWWVFIGFKFNCTELKVAVVIAGLGGYFCILYAYSGAIEDSSFHMYSLAIHFCLYING